MKLNPHSGTEHSFKASRIAQVGMMCAGMLILIQSGCDLPKRPPLIPEDAALEESGRAGSNKAAVQQTNPLDATLQDSKGNDSAAPRDSMAASPSSGNVNRPNANRFAADVFEAPGETYDQPWEAWEAFYFKDRQIGYSHISATPLEQSSKKQVRYSLENVMLFNQGQARTLQRVNLTSTESRTGKLIGFESTLLVGPVATKHNGNLITEVDGTQKLEIERVRGSRRTTHRMTWEPTFRGLFAVEQSLRAKPLRNEGDRRSIEMLLPSHFGMAKARLVCLGKRLSPLLDGKSEPLIEIQNQVELDDGTVTSMFLWTDDEGRLVRTLSPMLKLNAYRVSKAEATKSFASLNKSVVLPVEGDIQNPEAAKRIAFEISVLDRYANLESDQSASKAADQKTDADREEAAKPSILDVFPAPGQFVRKTSNNKFQLVVSRAGEKDRKGFQNDVMEPAPEDSQTNYFIDYNNALVRRFADAAVVSSEDRSQSDIAETLASTLKSLIQYDPSIRGLERASIVARDGKGGDTGQAVLLAALLRAKGIPSRIAIGLKYQDDPEEADRDHLCDCIWVICHADGQWIHLDPQTGEKAPPDRIVVTTTSLAGKDQDKIFVPFLNTVTRIKVKAIKAQY